jgi:hypothetical protein
LDPSSTYLWKGAQGTQLVTGTTEYVAKDDGSTDFSQVLAHPEDFIFAADNTVTREIFICFSSDGQDKALRFDYRQGTVSTSGASFSAACAVQRPESPTLVIAPEIWFVAGNQNGLVLRYGLINAQPKRSGPVTVTKPATGNLVTSSQAFFEQRMVGKSIRTASGKWFAIIGVTDATHATVLGTGAIAGETFTIENTIYHRDGQPYDGILQAGVDAFGASGMEKLLNGYVLFLGSQSPNGQVALALRAGVNPDTVADVLSTVIKSPQTNNLIKATMLGYYIGDRLTVSGVNHVVAVSGRTMQLSGVNSQSYFRKP